MLIVAARAQDTNIIAMEYFLDTDPGVGNGIPISFVSGPAPEANVVVPAANLTAGFHRIVVRAQDADGLWSTHETRSFLVNAETPLEITPVVQLEYYFDSDPGYGNGIQIPFTSGTEPEVTVVLPLAALSPGFHTVVLRGRDQDGHWSNHEGRSFYIHASQNIDRAEYFFDTDPGAGIATPLPITDSPDLEETITLAASSLPEGDHVIGVRVGREDDFWSETHLAPFSVCTPPVPGFDTDVVCVGTATNFTDISTNVSGGTYSWDFDGDGTEDANANSTTNFTYPAAGTYNASLTVSRFGCTEVFSEAVVVSEDPVADAGSDQMLCADATTLAANAPAPGETGMWTLLSGSASITDSAAPDTEVTGISGPVTLQWTVTNTAGGCSISDNVIIDISPSPVPGFTSDIVCEGAVTSFTDISTNAAGGIYSWDFDNDGIEDSNASGNTSFTYPTPGPHTATLTIDVAGCSATTNATVIVAALPAANAGDDQDLCVSETTLAGNTPAADETGTWTIISGNAMITDINDPASTVNNITSYTTTLEWTVASDAGGCSVADQVTIVSNQPITAALVSASVVIGQSVNRDVQSVATINTGDVLTTTIVTAPMKGVAVVESDGTITYTPDAEAIGTDIVTYEVCNQCDRCATNNLEVDIINNPPVITPPPVAVQQGQSVDVDLLSIISDANDNLDPSSLAIIEQPISGALATIDASYHLIIDYDGVFFSGTDELTIRACDLSGDCSDNVILIEVEIAADPLVNVYNAVSPNGDGRHDFLELENIEAYPDNHVYIVNRWGVKVFDALGYDNDQVRFGGLSNQGGGKELPSGTYYYSVDLRNGSPRINGFLMLKR